MDQRLAEFLDDLFRRGREHDADRPDRLDRLRNLEPETARLLAVLVRATRAREILELGTSNGYSTIWLADAAGRDGRVVSVDDDPDRTAQARENLAAAGLLERAELRTEDAAETLRAAAGAAWDLVFLDSERPAYPGYWPDLVRTLRPGGTFVVDNVLSHAEEVAPFRALVAADDRCTEALVPTGAGALVVVRD